MVVVVVVVVVEEVVVVVEEVVVVGIMVVVVVVGGLVVTTDLLATVVELEELVLPTVEVCEANVVEVTDPIVGTNISETGSSLFLTLKEVIESWLTIFTICS